MPANPALVDALLGVTGGYLKVYDIAAPGVYTTGGVVMSAQQFGLLSLKFLDGMMTTDGLNFARAIPPSGPGASTITVKWYVASTGAEVANNSTSMAGKIARFLAIGN